MEDLTGHVTHFNTIDYAPEVWDQDDIKVIYRVTFFKGRLTFQLEGRWYRVWKGILGIRDLTKIRCGNRENDKYLVGIRDLTAPREGGFAKIWAWDAEFFRLFVENSGNHHDPKKRPSSQSRWCLLSNQTSESILFQPDATKVYVV